MLISSVNPWVIIAPVLAAQYILALVAFVFLAKRSPGTKSFVLWNLLILFVFFAGSIAFLIYNKIHPVTPEPQKAEEKNGEMTDSNISPENEKEKEDERQETEK